MLFLSSPLPCCSLPQWAITFSSSQQMLSSMLVGMKENGEKGVSQTIRDLRLEKISEKNSLVTLGLPDANFFN